MVVGKLLNLPKENRQLNVQSLLIAPVRRAFFDSNHPIFQIGGYRANTVAPRIFLELAIGVEPTTC